MRNEIWVRATFCIGHRDVVRAYHGHSYELWALFSEGDAHELRADLERVAALFDHQMMPDHLTHCEAIARVIIDAWPAVLAVELNRPVEGIRVRVSRA